MLAAVAPDISVAPTGAAAKPRANQLFFGDNLEVLRGQIPAESVDLVYLDPPFNSDRTYNVIFERRPGHDARAQIEAFDDTWTWSQETEAVYQELVARAQPEVSDLLVGFRRHLGDNDMLAYLVMMAPRLLELRRVLRPTGTLWLHCDPTAQHYLKILLDAIFGAALFVNEVVWKRTHSHGDARRNFGSVFDTLLVYAKSDRYNWNTVRKPLSDELVASKFRYVDAGGRRWQSVTLRSPNPRPNLRYAYHASDGHTYRPHPNGWSCDIARMREYDAEGRLHFPAKSSGQLRLKMYLDESRGTPLQNLWTDIPPINSQAQERLGYPTQKPEALLSRIIEVATGPGDTVLDPFCGCGTAIQAAHALRRRWIGIDITYIAVDLTEKRMRWRFGEQVLETIDYGGSKPRDLAGARAIFQRSPFEFQRWAVSLIDGAPNERRAGDRGVDGIVRFPLDVAGNVGRVLVSVKGGGVVSPTATRDLLGTVETQRAEMGVLITLERPTRGVIEAARHSGTYVYPLTGRSFERIQVLSIDELLGGRKPSMPTPLLPYIRAERAEIIEQLELAYGPMLLRKPMPKPTRPRRTAITARPADQELLPDR